MSALKNPFIEKFLADLEVMRERPNRLRRLLLEGRPEPMPMTRGEVADELDKRAVELRAEAGEVEALARDLRGA